MPGLRHGGPEVRGERLRSYSRSFRAELRIRADDPRRRSPYPSSLTSKLTFRKSPSRLLVPTYTSNSPGSTTKSMSML